MNSAKNVGNGSNAVILVVRILLLVLVLVGAYYLYKYLFTSSGLEIMSVNQAFIAADKAANGAASFSKMFEKQVYSGGELTVNMWVYLQDLQRVNGGAQNHIFSLGKAATGGSTLDGDQTMIVYLEPYKSDLSVALSLEPKDAQENTTIVGSTIKTSDNKLSVPSSHVRATVKGIELQKWVMLTFCINNKILDIYVDGKLARSVVLDAMYKVGGVATDGLYFNAAAYGGFGGYIGNTKMANYALNPEEVWRLYMSGPSEPFSFTSWFLGLFDPDYLKKMTMPGQV
jgi:hypothetical protein